MNFPMKTTSFRAAGRTVLIIAAFASGTIAFADRPAAAKAPATPARRALPRDITAETITRGREIFHGRGNCFQCHGQNGTGTFVAPALNDDRHIHLQTASLKEIAERIRTGVGQPKQYSTPMPPAGGAALTSEEIRAIAAYVFTLDRSP